MEAISPHHRLLIEAQRRPAPARFVFTTVTPLGHVYEDAFSVAARQRSEGVDPLTTFDQLREVITDANDVVNVIYYATLPDDGEAAEGDFRVVTRLYEQRGDQLTGGLDNPGSFLPLFKDWNENMTRAIELEGAELEELNEVARQLNSIPGLLATEIAEERQVLEFELVTPSRRDPNALASRTQGSLDADSRARATSNPHHQLDVISIFDHLATTPEVPFIYYEDENRTIFKVYRDINIKHFANHVLRRDRKPKGEAIHLYVWNMEGSPPADPAKQSYTAVSIIDRRVKLTIGSQTLRELAHLRRACASLGPDVISVRSEQGGRRGEEDEAEGGAGDASQATAAPTKHKSSAASKEARQLSIVASFYVQLDTLNVTSFLHAIALVPPYNQLFYLEERSVTVTSDQLVKLRYRRHQQKSIPVSLALVDHSARGSDGVERMFRCLKVVCKNTDLATTNDIKIVLSRLLALFVAQTSPHHLATAYGGQAASSNQGRLPSIIPPYPGVEPIYLKLNDSLIKRKVKTKTMCSLFPNIEALTRRVQTSPLVLRTESEVNDWRARGHEILYYQGHCFVCDNPQRPYPGLIIIDDRDGVKQAVPNCYQVSHNVPGTALYAYCQGQLEQFIASKSEGAGDSHRHGRSLAPLRAGHQGEAGDDVSMLIGARASRRCVDTGPNSFLSAVVHATEPVGEDITEIRARVARAMHPNTARQEMYDMSNEEIVEYQLGDDYYDPLRMVHLLEEYFNVNIFLFQYRQGDLTVVTPRHREGYVRFIPDRECVVIIKQPHSSEYVFSDTGSMFSVEVTRRIRDAIAYSATNLRYDVPDSPGPFSLANEASSGHHAPSPSNGASSASSNHHEASSGHDSSHYAASSDHHAPPTARGGMQLNPGLHVDYRSLFNPTAQLIDSCGKVRAFRTAKFDVIVPPAQPMNLPSMEGFLPADPEVVLASFTTPPSSINRDGLWYPLFGVPDLVFVPVDFLRPSRSLAERSEGRRSPSGRQSPIAPLPSTSGRQSPSGRLSPIPSPPEPSIHQALLAQLPSGPDNDVYYTTSLAVNEMSRLRRDSNLFVQVMTYLYYLYLAVTPDGNAAAFANAYLAVYETPPSNYTLIGLPRQLPIVSSVSEAIARLGQTHPLVFNNGHFCLYDLRLWEKMTYLLRELSFTYDEGHTFPNTTITGYYDTPDNFLPHPRTVIIFGHNELSKYHSFLVNQRQRLVTSFSDLSSEAEEPIVYRHPQGAIYLLQNVYRGALASAMRVAVTWFLSRTNLGFHAPPLTDTINHYLYTSDDYGELMILSDADASAAYVELYRYPGKAAYAALLPLT
jgi:hypothetical protein